MTKASFSIVADIPYTASVGALDIAELTVSSISHPSLPTYQRSFQTRNMPQWEIAAPLPGNDIGMSVVGLETAYHAIGGVSFYNSENMGTAHQRFDPCLQGWESRAPLPEPRVFAASAAIGDRLFVAGGMNFIDSIDIPNDTLFIYDTATDSWSQGAPMPRSLYWTTGAAVSGKLYVFGGYDGLESSGNFFSYDPATNQWEDRGAMPPGPAYMMASAVYNDEIYLVGGLPYSYAFVRYTPATNTWTWLSSPWRVRYGVSLVAASDGFLYLAGGSGGSSLVERYNLATNEWSDVNNTLEEYRLWGGGVYLEGTIYLVGGAEARISHESLRLTGSFCESTLLSPQSAVGVNGEILYTVELHASDRDQPNARLVAPLHPNQSFVGFSKPVEGAVWTANHTVEWHGTILANSPPLRLAYTASLNDGAWKGGDLITHTVQMENGRGRRLTSSTTAMLFEPDFSASAKEVSQPSVAAGNPFTYTIRLGSHTPVGGPVSFTDPLPTDLDFVPGSLTPDTGAAIYDPGTHALRWSGSVGLDHPGTVNLSSDYVWADNLGSGVGSARSFVWRDIRTTGQPVVSGADAIACDTPIGFEFPFFAANYTAICVDVNGLLTFAQADTYPNPYNNCPMAGSVYDSPKIAGLWTSLTVEDSVYVQTFGKSPYQYTIFQWTDARYWDSWNEYLGISNPPDTDFQIVLHENGLIKTHILRSGKSVKRWSTTGLSGPNTGPNTGQSITYQCNRNRTGLEDKLSVEFMPPGGIQPIQNQPISFQMTAKPGIAPNSLITNTVTIRSGVETYTRTVGLLVQSVDLASSVKTASRTELLPGESVTYTIALHNSGLAPAQQATLSDTLPAGLTYSPASLACSSGVCSENGGRITWQGSLQSGSTLTVTYAATLNAVLTDRTPLTNTAQIDAIGVSNLRRSAVVYARSTNLSASFFEFGNKPNEPGDRFTLRALLRNTGIQSSVADFSLSLPAELSYIPGTLRCGIGHCRIEPGRLADGRTATDRILWSGTLPPRGLVAVEMDVRLADGLTAGQRIRVSGEIIDSTWGQTQPVIGDLFVAFHTFLPLMLDGRIPPLYLPVVENRYGEIPILEPVPTPTAIPASPLPTPTPTPFGR
jgi:uncharacterized repeat protein (TIGR01451 family)